MRDELQKNLAVAERYLEVGQPKRAIEALDGAAGLGLQDEHYWYLRAQALYDLDLYDEAVRVIESGLALDPDHMPLLYLLCCCYDNLGNMPEAEKAILAAIRLWPDHPGLLSRYALLVAKAGQLDKADKLLEKAARLDPDEPSVLRARTLLAYLRGNDKQVGEESRRLLSEDPDDVYGHLMLGVSESAEGSALKASRYFRNAVQIDPGNADAAELAREARFRAHWLMVPLWPLYRVGTGVAYVAGVGTFFVLKQIGLTDIAYGFISLYLLLCIYSWTVPPLLRWWLRRRFP